MKSLRPLLVILSITSASVQLRAQIVFQVEGVVTSLAPNSHAKVGDAVEFSEDILFPLVNDYGYLTTGQRSYRATNSKITIGETSYQLNPWVSDPDIGAFYNWGSGFYGALFSEGGYYAGGLSNFQMEIWTTNPDFVASDGLPLPGLPLESFERLYGSLNFDDEPLGSWEITSYSITRPSAVPEPSSYGLLGVVAILGLAGNRLRRKPSGA